MTLGVGYSIGRSSREQQEAFLIVGYELGNAFAVCAEQVGDGPGAGVAQGEADDFGGSAVQKAALSEAAAGVPGVAIPSG